MQRIPKEENPRKIEYYIKNYPDLSEEEIKVKHRWYRRSCNYRYPEYYERLYPEKTSEEREELRNNRLKLDRPKYIEYWENKYPEKTHDEIELLWKEANKGKRNEDSPKHWEYYKRLYPELTIEECKEKEKWFKKTCNYQCIEYYEKRYPELPHNEHIKLLTEALNKHKYNTPTNIKYWEAKYPEKTHDEIKAMFSQFMKERNFQSIEYFKRKFPELSEEECEKLRKQRVKEYVDNREPLVGEKNGMHRSRRTEQELKENSPWAIEFYQKRYPDLSLEEQEKLRDDMIKKTQENVGYNNCQIEYYTIKLGMSQEEAEEALKERQATCRLDKFIKRYGEKEGFERWASRQSKWKSSIQKSFVTQKGVKYIIQSGFANKIIQYLCEKLNIEIPDAELPLRSDDNKITFLYDFTYKNKIIEFNGDYWHANPIKYSSDWYNSSMKKTAKEIWDRDKAKHDCAVSHGYDIMYVWESEWDNDKSDVIEKCLKFLNNENKELDNKTNI